LIDTVKPLVQSIRIPTLIIQGQLDRVVEPSGAMWVHENLGASEKTLVVLPRSDHLVALDCERDRVISLARDFALPSDTSLSVADSAAPRLDTA
jgi:esterase/lipase